MLLAVAVRVCGRDIEGKGINGAYLMLGAVVVRVLTGAESVMAVWLA